MFFISDCVDVFLFHLLNSATALFLAVNEGNEDIVGILLQNGADTNVLTMTA